MNGVMFWGRVFKLQNWPSGSNDQSNSPDRPILKFEHSPPFFEPDQRTFDIAVPHPPSIAHKNRLCRATRERYPWSEPMSDAHQQAAPGLAVNPLGVAVEQDFSLALIESIAASNVLLHDRLGLDNR